MKDAPRRRPWGRATTAAARTGRHFGPAPGKPFPATMLARAMGAKTPVTQRNARPPWLYELVLSSHNVEGRSHKGFNPPAGRALEEPNRDPALPRRNPSGLSPVPRAKDRMTRPTRGGRATGGAAPPTGARTPGCGNWQAEPPGGTAFAPTKPTRGPADPGRLNRLADRLTGATIHRALNHRRWSGLGSPPCAVSPLHRAAPCRPGAPGRRAEVGAERRTGGFEVPVLAAMGRTCNATRPGRPRRGSFFVTGISRNPSSGRAGAGDHLSTGYLAVRLRALPAAGPVARGEEELAR